MSRVRGMPAGPQPPAPYPAESPPSARANVYSGASYKPRRRKRLAETASPERYLCFRELCTRWNVCCAGNDRREKGL